MRLSICTVALATLFGSTLAAPTAKPDSVEDTPKEAGSGIVRRDGDDGKYFHEPGYVVTAMSH
jgi:hypothetical protein